jgi:thioredoxin-related protein
MRGWPTTSSGRLDKQIKTIYTLTMRLRFFVAVGLLAAMTGWADDKLPLLKAGSEVYSNVTILSSTATDVFFTYNNGRNNNGMANVKLKDLSPELQKHFHYNAAKAHSVEQKQTAANTQYYSLITGQPAIRPPDESREQSAADEQTSGLSWGTDLPAALNQAQSDNKMVLLDFTGSDWCPWCIKFDHDVLSTGEFAGYAKSKLVLVQLDFPRTKPQSDDLKQANAALAKRFNVDGYPTYVLLNPAGDELGRQVGYREGGPDAFIAELDGFSKR